ncbi:hypothetical protein T484DRAFT_1983770 [Baffinella frigidus]|nr:hypothetical protein T484DRAFT_1983770 [Cryptophyta sp. CCMP2293]
MRRVPTPYQDFRFSLPETDLCIVSGGKLRRRASHCCTGNSINRARVVPETPITR